ATIDVPLFNGEGDGHDPRVRFPCAGAVDAVPEGTVALATDAVGVDARIRREDSYVPADEMPVGSAIIASHGRHIPKVGLNTLGDRVLFAAILQAFDADIGHGERQAACPARHEDRNAGLALRPAVARRG